VGQYILAKVKLERALDARGGRERSGENEYGIAGRVGKIRPGVESRTFGPVRGESQGKKETEARR
jgi:hypothetical protein